MIFQQKQLAKKGISLIEVIITISIIGILSSAVVPTYQFFNKKKEELELEKNILISFHVGKPALIS